MARLRLKISPEVFSRSSCTGDAFTYAGAKLERHSTAQCALVDVLALARIDDGAAIHHDEAIAQLTREVEVLLDQHDRNLPQIAQVGNGAADVLDNRRLDA